MPNDSVTTQRIYLPNLHYIRGLVDPTEKFLYLDISKNASTKILTILRNAGWTDPPGMAHKDEDAFLEDKKIFCVLREPYQRYISGFVSFLAGQAKSDYDNVAGYTIRKLIRFDNQSNFDMLRLLFSGGAFEFDTHTELQNVCLAPYDINKIDFFYLNDKLGFQLNKYFRSHNITIPFNNEKVNESSNENFHKVLLKKFFADKENIMFKESLLKYLEPDYELIKSVNFYNV